LCAGVKCELAEAAQATPSGSSSSSGSSNRKNGTNVPAEQQIEDTSDNISTGAWVHLNEYMLECSYLCGFHLCSASRAM